MWVEAAHLLHMFVALGFGLLKSLLGSRLRRGCGRVWGCGSAAGSGSGCLCHLYIAHAQTCTCRVTCHCTLVWKSAAEEVVMEAVGGVVLLVGMAGGGVVDWGVASGAGGTGVCADVC